MTYMLLAEFYSTTKAHAEERRSSLARSSEPCPELAVGLQAELQLGNLNARRDWGHAKDYVEAMWLMLQQEKPDDYVIATGKQYSVKDFVDAAAPYFGFNIEWRGEGLDEFGY